MKRYTFVIAWALGVNGDGGLSDAPVLGSTNAVFSVSSWIATSGVVSIESAVPGDLVTDLERGGG